MQIELDPTEQRVIGSLLEKERTVPDTYPMTLNAVRTACNQSSGRDPVMAIGEHEVHTALDTLALVVPVIVCDRPQPIRQRRSTAPVERTHSWTSAESWR